MTNRRQPEATILPVQFEDRSGPEFERLCFAKWPSMLRERNPAPERLQGGHAAR